MQKIDELWTDVRKLQANFRKNEMAEALDGLDFKSGEARRDFQALLRGNVQAHQASFQCPENLSLREYAKREFSARPELHAAEAAKPETDQSKSASETAAPSGKQFMLEDIHPGMSDSQLAAAWEAIQRALGIEPNDRRYRHE